MRARWLTVAVVLLSPAALFAGDAKAARDRAGGGAAGGGTAGGSEGETAEAVTPWPHRLQCQEPG